MVDTDLLARLETEHQYDVVDTCAMDGMYQTACPDGCVQAAIRIVQAQ